MSCRRRSHKRNAPPSIMIAAMAPSPIPAFAPDDKPPLEEPMVCGGGAVGCVFIDAVVVAEVRSVEDIEGVVDVVEMKPVDVEGVVD